METIGKNLLLNTSGKTKNQVKLPNVFESDLLKTNKEIALQSHGVYRCLFGGGKFGKFASLSFKALFLAVSVDIGLLVFIKTLKNPMERSVEGVCALIIIIMIIIIIIIILIIIMDW